MLWQPLHNCDEGRVFAVENPGIGNLRVTQPDIHPKPTAEDWANARAQVGREMAEQAVIRARQAFNHS